MILVIFISFIAKKLRKDYEVNPNIEVLQNLDYYRLNIVNEKRNYFKKIKSDLLDDEKLNLFLTTKYDNVDNISHDSLSKYINDLVTSKKFDDFILNTEEFKNFEIWLAYKLCRSIQLSKYIHNKSNYELLKALTKDEHTRLKQFEKQKYELYNEFRGDLWNY